MVKKERTNADGLGILGLLDDPRYHRAEARSMSQLIPSFLILVEPCQVIEGRRDAQGIGSHALLDG